MNDDTALFSLRGRVALVTGASGGIGMHAARLYARAGAAVVLAARRLGLTEDAARELRGQGHCAAAVELDVTRADSVEQAFEAARRALGAPVDVLLNNAGVIQVRRFVEYEEAELARILDTNLKGAFLVAQAAARGMVALGRGSIVNVASTSGLRAGGFMAGYAASKAGLIHLTRVMALELGSKGVRANALCPGNIDTDMQAPLSAFRETMLRRTPLRRFGACADLDGALLLLASDAGRYMTGSVITVDGGQTLSWM